MRLFLPLLFLTLVLMNCPTGAAPQTTTTLKSSPLNANEDPLLENSDPTTPRRNQPSLFLNLAVGFSGGNYLERDDYQQGPYLALRYAPFKWVALPTWDYQAEVNKDNIIGLSIGRRWYCCPDDAFLPYVRLSGSTFLEGSGELAGLFETRRWRARASVGVGERLTSEFGVGTAVTGPDLFAQFGYNFAF